MGNDNFTRPQPRILPITAEGIRLQRNQRKLLDDVNLELDDTGTTVVMGPNGAGKSLLLRILAGLLAPDAGSVAWCGRQPDIGRRTSLGFVFQKPVLLRRSALANIKYALAVAGYPRQERQSKAEQALALAGLTQISRSAGRSLSGGEQQRLAIARALALQPEVLMMDEPTANLDPASVHQIESLIKQSRDRGCKVVFVTHDVGQAKRLADDVVFMARGRIVEQASGEQFLEAPSSEQSLAYLQGRLLV
jgi:tungstate transport system ATP-binding protein